MPQYKYKREDGSTFTINHSINDKLDVCPDTGQKVKRLISSIGGVSYKGSGWNHGTGGGWKLKNGPRPLEELREREKNRGATSR
jgi:hypothetical protein